MPCKRMYTRLFLRLLPYLGSQLRVFINQVRRYRASSLAALVSPSSVLVFLCSISPPQIWTSHLSVSIHLHLLITTPSYIFLSTCPNHFSLAYRSISFTFTTPALVHISSVFILLLSSSPTLYNFPFTLAGTLLSQITQAFFSTHSIMPVLSSSLLFRTLHYFVQSSPDIWSRPHSLPLILAFSLCRYPASRSHILYMYSVFLSTIIDF